MIRINLAPEVRRGPAAGLRLGLPALGLGTLFGALYVLALIVIGLYWWSLASEETRLTAEIAAGKKELEQLKIVIGEGQKVKAQAVDFQKRLAVLQELVKGQARPILLADTFASMIPQDLWITGLEERESKLKVTGSAFSSAAVSNFMQNLRASGKFKEVDITVARRDLSKPTGLVTFEVTCRFEG